MGDEVRHHGSRQVGHHPFDRKFRTRQLIEQVERGHDGEALARKGAVTVGLPTADGPGVLLKSAASFAQATWLHLRLDVIVNTNGDVVLKVFQNDLALHALGTPPDWQPVSGMVEFIDDHLGINSGSQPLTSGRGGFGFSVKDVTRRAYFDHLELFRQV